MTFSYSGNPSSSPHDAVRFLTGDTNEAEPKLADEEIAFLLLEWDADLYQASAAAADHMAATAASWMSYSADGNSLNLSELQQKYYTLAEQLRVQGKRRGRAVFYVGGIDLADHESNQSDDSVNPLSFAIGMHDDTQEGPAYGTFDVRDLKGESPW